MAHDALQGRVRWYELMTADMKGAERFYSTVLGWSSAPFEGSPEPYSMWMRAGDIPVGGYMTIPQGMHFPPNWMMYVLVNNLDQARGAIEKAGGKTLSEVIVVPTVGKMQPMTDPQGAAFSIYHPENPPPAPEAKAELGEVSWHALMTTDAEGALKFYAPLFGWKERNAMDMGPMGKYYIWGRGWDLGGIMTKTPGMAPIPNNWGFYVRVPDVKQSAEVVKAAVKSSMVRWRCRAEAGS